MFLWVQLFSLNVAALLSLRTKGGSRFAMIHRHCTQQTFHMPLVQLDMPPEIIHRNSTFEKMGLSDAHASSSQFQPSLPGMILEFICQTFQIGC